LPRLGAVTAPETELRQVWRRLAGAGHDTVIDGLLARHREPHRRYHTATHVMWVCRHVTELSTHHRVDDVDAVLAAGLFHDAVYEPRSSTNEADSAALAVRELSDVGWPANRCSMVARLVNATAHQATAHDHSAQQHAQPADEAVLLDADLAVLGGQANEYLAYSTAVRTEYAHVDDRAWRDGRSRVLQHFLGLEFIFRTSTMRQAREVRARANLSAELASLDHSQQ
jgi:predicted metal-dependent HD superfamily phosphohydrolase